jgi:lipopolysaccharide export system protein LptA
MPNAINKVEFFTNIIVTSDDDIAEGQHGIYDVKQDMIFLDTNVALTHGKNIVKGERLVYNVATGKSDIYANAENTPSNASASQPKKAGRVSGVFIPKKDNEGK